MKFLSSSDLRDMPGTLKDQVRDEDLVLAGCSTSTKASSRGRGSASLRGTYASCSGPSKRLPKP